MNHCKTVLSRLTVALQHPSVGLRHTERADFLRNMGIQGLMEEEMPRCFQNLLAAGGVGSRREEQKTGNTPTTRVSVCECCVCVEMCMRVVYVLC